MLGKATSSPQDLRRSGRVSGAPGGTAAPEAEREAERAGGGPGEQRRRTQRPLRGSGEALARVLTAISAEARLGYSGRIIAVALALGMLLSPALWLTRPSGASLEDSFPLAPPIGGLEMLALPAPLDMGLLGSVLALCALAVVLPGRRLILGALFAALLLIALPDLMRWQPWVYLYLTAIGVLAFVPARSSKAPRMLAWVEPVTVLRIIVASVYLYSGLNKLNASFFEEGLRGFLAGMPGIISSGPVADTLTYLAPGMEVIAGLGLLLGGLAGMRRVRYAALALAVSTNLFVLVALVAAAANAVVWPWNLAMIALVIILFAGGDRREGLSPQTGAPGRTSGNVAGLWGYTYALVIVALAAVMPAAGVLGYWPPYLSFALYSENTPGAMVDMPGPGGRTVVIDLAYEQLGVPAYPAQAVYLALGEQACGSRQMVPRGSGEPVLDIQSRPGILDGARESREYTCGSDPVGKISPGWERSGPLNKRRP